MQFAGDYKLDSVIVHSASGSIDIKALMIELNVYESIHADNLYGSMVVADSANHVQNMPIIGQEDIEFKLSTNEDTEQLDFKKFRGRIYKVSDMVRTAERQQVYTIHFSSKETLINQRTRVKSAYEGSGDEVVSQILKDVLKTKKSVNIEPSDLKVKLLGNNMKPFKFINMVSKRCRSRVFEGAGYLFFENHRGYNFRSYESLSNSANGPREPVEKFIVQPSKYEASITENMQSVLEYKIMKQQDVLAASMTGLLASTHYVYDLYTKSYKKIETRYDDMFDDLKHVEKESLFTTTPEEEGEYKTMFDYAEQRIDVSTKDDALHSQANDKTNIWDTDELKSQSDEDTRVYDNHSSKFHLRNHSELSHDQLVAKVTVSGNSNLAAGDVIELHVPSYEPISPEDTRVHDAYLSGRWVITNLVHTISPDRYTTTFDCVKDTVAISYATTDTTIQSSTNYNEKEQGTNTLNEAHDA